MVPPMQLHAIPAFTDNYLWTLVADGQAVVVDPGDAAPVSRFLAEQNLTLTAILITHHHPDHIGGLGALLRERSVPVYGPRAEAEKIRLLSHPLDDGDAVEVFGRRFEIFALPGHTLGHIAYFSAATATQPGVLLCGDTLFSAGCGRLFEGTPGQMHESLARLATLPDDTQVYCTHEYTLSNLAFAAAVEPENSDVRNHTEHVRQIRANGHPSLPSTLALERRINPFLRADVATVRRATEQWGGSPLKDETEVFAALRRWKDVFKPS